jgi:hypothetical protein
MKGDSPAPVLSLWFWLAIALAFLCIAAGAVVGVYGPKLFPPHAASPQTLGKLAPAR